MACVMGVTSSDGGRRRRVNRGSASPSTGIRHPNNRTPVRRQTSALATLPCADAGGGRTRPCEFGNRAPKKAQIRYQPKVARNFGARYSTRSLKRSSNLSATGYPDGWPVLVFGFFSETLEMVM